MDLKVKTIITGIVLLALIQACSKAPSPKTCSYGQPLAGDFISQEQTLIPLNTRNFWVYDDSSSHNGSGMMLNTSNFMLYIKDVYKAEERYSLEFNQWIPRLTLFGDSLYSTLMTPEAEKPGCFEYEPFLIRPQDTLYYHTATKTKIYQASGVISTRKGPIDYDYIYEITGASRFYLNDRIGIIRMELFDQDGNVIRSQTLNNYEVK